MRSVLFYYIRYNDLPSGQSLQRAMGFRQKRGALIVRDESCMPRVE